MSRWTNRTAHFAYGNAILEVDYVYLPGDPGRLSGPPEKCYPPEPPEVEVKGLRVLGGTLLEVFDELGCLGAICDRLLEEHEDD